MDTIHPTSRTVVVTGDVTMDWNLAHVEIAPVSGWSSEATTRACWQRGGAALLADLVESVAGTLPEKIIQVRQPCLPRTPIHPSDERFDHSYAMWSKFKSSDKKPADVWRVAEFLGLDRRRGTPSEENDRMLRVNDDTATADLVVLDDAGLGFRDRPELWPQAITAGDARPWIVLKMSQPVAKGPLWENLLSRLADRLIVVTSANDLRRTEVQISRQLSWERTAQDLIWELVHNPLVNGLSRCAHTIISFGTSGAVLLSGLQEGGTVSRLLFDPLVVEGGWSNDRQGKMIGYTATLTAAIARQLLLQPGQPDLEQAVQTGIAAMRRLYQTGYGEPNSCESCSCLAFPFQAMAAAMAETPAPLAVVPVRDPVESLLRNPDPAVPRVSRNAWTILEDRYPEGLNRLAERIVLEGLSAALAAVPQGAFGALVAVDRREIEALRSVQGLMAEYCRRPQKRPLSIAVFGPPGAGKSFGVEQVAESVMSGSVKTCTFNLSQLAGPDALLGALHQVRDVGLSGKIPLVFWDEFDTSLGGLPLGWLRYFLAPMQDGSFQEGQLTHPIGQAIFVFAGGTCDRMEDFGRNLETEAARKAAKVPDFVSRLKGFLNVLGPNRQESGDGCDPYSIIRRAILLRSLLERNVPHLLRGKGNGKVLNIDGGVLRACLEIGKYKHGVRSMESIMAMSTLAGKASFERSSLPSEAQLDLHVDGQEFLALVHQITLTDELVEKLAEAAHDIFVAGKVRDGWKLGEKKCEEAKTHPLLVSYAVLPEAFKEANRVTVCAIPQKLAAAGYIMRPARSNEPALDFPGEDLEKLARLEHALWMEAKLKAGFQLGSPTPEDPKKNEYLVAWEDVPDKIKQIDRDLIRGIPVILARAGYAVEKARRPSAS